MARHESGNGRDWAAVRQEKMEAIDVLPPTQAILGLLKVINKEDGSAAETQLLWDIMLLSRLRKSAPDLLPQFEDCVDLRLIRSFEGPDKYEDWKLNLSEKFGYIRQMDYANFWSGYWYLNPLGTKNLNNHIEENGIMPIQQHEIDGILEVVARIRGIKGWGRQPIAA